MVCLMAGCWEKRLDLNLVGMLVPRSAEQLVACSADLRAGWLAWLTVVYLADSTGAPRAAMLVVEKAALRVAGSVTKTAEKRGEHLAGRMVVDSALKRAG